MKAQIGRPKNAVTPSPKFASRPESERMECHTVAQSCYSILAQTFKSPKVLTNIKRRGYQEVQLSKQLLKQPYHVLRFKEFNKKRLNDEE